MTQEVLKQVEEALEACEREPVGGVALKEIRSALAALRAAQQWRQWPDETDEHDYPPDETDVLIYCGGWFSKDVLVGRISRRSGVYGPSGATHWMPIPAPPQEPQ